MKDEARGKLLRDTFAGELAGVRRRERCRRIWVSGAGALCVAGLVGVFGFPSQESSEEAPIAVVPEEQVSEPERDEVAVILEELADAGPLIVTQADGRRILFLTRAVIERP